MEELAVDVVNEMDTMDNKDFLRPQSPLPQNKTAGHRPGSFVNLSKLYTTPQSLILKSSLALAITLPSGEKATDCTSCVWPR